MPDRHTHAPSPSLLPAGRRWGRGAHTVLPYLASTRTLASAEADAAADAEAIRNPVFRTMDLPIPRVEH